MFYRSCKHLDFLLLYISAIPAAFELQIFDSNLLNYIYVKNGSLHTYFIIFDDLL